MRHKKYQKVSDLVGKVRVKYDEDLSWYEAMRPVPDPEGDSVKSLERRALKGYKKGLASIK